MESDLVKHSFLSQFILISYRKRENCQLLTRIKKQRLKCLWLIQFSGVLCSLCLFMSCNPRQNLIQNIFTIFRKNEDQRTNGPVNAHLISWPSKAQKIQNPKNIWLRNDLHLQYSHTFIISISCLHLPTFRSQASIVSEKSTVFTFSYRKA